jgi:hypothetical protein
MNNLFDFREIKLSELQLLSFTGGTDNSHIGCVDCSGNTEVCMSSTTCDDVDCPKGNDTGGTKAKTCGASAPHLPEGVHI